MKVVSNENNYDDFLKTRFISGNFLQSSLWRDFLKKQKINYWQLAVLADSGETLATALIYEKALPMGRSFLYCPKGPMVSHQLKDQQRQEALSLLLSQVRQVTIDTKKREEIFLKLEPSDTNLVFDEFKKTADVQPRDSWIVDIKPEPKEILASMHAKTRYNIALARRRGVEIIFSKNANELKHFFKLNKITSERNKISTHHEKHYELLLQTLVENGAGELALAKVKDQVVAVNIVLYFGQAATYLHGASDYAFRKYMGPHLLQWQSILRAREYGYKIYDFWGIAPEDGSKSNWQGITRFKKGFGGRPTYSPGAYDLVYDKTWYNFYSLISKARRFVRKIK